MQFCFIWRSVVKLKGRTRRLLPPMSQPGFAVQRDNEWRAVYAGVYVNPATDPGWIKKTTKKQNKTGGEPNERERWNVTTKLSGLNSFHSNTKRKKERNTKWRAKWPTSKFKMSPNVSQVWRIRSIGKKKKKKNKNKNKKKTHGSMSVLGSAICRSCVSSLVRRVLWHMQISARQNWYKRSNLSLVVSQ